MEKKIEKIVHELYSGGGYGQALMLLSTLIDSKQFPNMEDFLRMVGRRFDEHIEIMEKRTIIPIEMYDYLAENGEKYTCLDKDLKFCVKRKGDSDWKDVAYVMPRFDTTKASDIIYKHQKK